MHEKIHLGDIAIDELLALAKREDVGDVGDLTTQLMPEAVSLAPGRWRLINRQSGRFCSPELLARLLPKLAPELQIKHVLNEQPTAEIPRGTVLAEFTGITAQMLTAERTMLNILQHLSGIATLTAKYVQAVFGTHAKIFDTRKTTPGLRALEKYAVQCGGGHNHRFGLWDAVLIKDNHLAGVPDDRLAHCIFEMLNRVPALPVKPKFVEVECESVEQAAELFKIVGIDVILLDNFHIDKLRAVVELRERSGLRNKIQLEASGGITIDNVRQVAETGVDRISIGAITHSAPILDLGIDAY